MIIMKDFKMHVPEDTYTLSRADIAVIHALCASAPYGMMKVWANIVRAKLEEQFRFHEAIGIYKVWME